MRHYLNTKLVNMQKINMTTKEWERILAVKPEEKKKAMRNLARWVTSEITNRGFNLNYGPFSFSAMGGNAVEVISEECYEALFCGEWHWKETRNLTSMLIQIAKSKMCHIVRDYYKNGEPEMMLTSQMNPRQEVEMEMAYQWEMEAGMRELGYDIARNVVKDNAKLTAYLDALYEENDYAGIAKRLNMTKNEVMEQEKHLLEILEQCNILQL